MQIGVVPATPATCLPPPFCHPPPVRTVVAMRYETTVTSLSWIPSEAVRGVNRVAFDAGFTHYDEPPPDEIEDLDALRRADRFRFANRLSAWIEVEGGRVVNAGYSGQGQMGTTTVKIGVSRMTFQTYAMPDIQHPPQFGDGWVRFVQTTGGRTNLPAPRRVRRKPFVQFRAPLVWTTLALTIHIDGSSTWEVVGASGFPRHWIYSGDRLVAKVGLTEFKDWYRKAFGKHSPWGDEDSPAVVTAAETALERSLAALIMRGGDAPELRSVNAGSTLVSQGESGDELFLVLDGVLRVDVDGERLAEFGPGALLGERAVLEGGTRSSTLTAVTHCRVAVARADQVDRAALLEVSDGHRREEQARTGA
jgi:hypothetical protein